MTCVMLSRCIMEGDDKMLRDNNLNNLLMQYYGPIDREVTILDLSFKERESLSIKIPTGEIIQLQVLDSSQDSAMLVIDAPFSCTVCREESFPGARETH
jgi:sRNA-binding carbon storage regulator CsrA